tara:strand:+ start:5742 stop:6539 length:798 start_codon:yes stop_codon:yes gene_type:complete
MTDIKKIQSYFRITTKAFNRKRKDNRAALWEAYKGVFRGLKGESLDPITYFINDEHKLVYVVNSKAACSAIKQAMMSSTGVDVNGADYWDVHQAGIDKGYVRKNLSEKEKKYFFFTFVRDPFSRIASLYLNKFCDQTNISQKGFEYKTYLGGILERNDSFERFVTKVSRIPDVLCDRHFKPQAYLINQELEKIDFVGKFENLNRDYERLRKDFCLKKLNVVNKSSDYSLSDIYTHTTLDLVAKRYEEDIEQFGYANEYDKIKAML